MGLNDCLKSYLLIPLLFVCRAFLCVKSVASSDDIPRLLLLQTLFKYLKHHQDNDFTSEIYSLYLYFNEKNLKPHLDSLYTTRASKNHAFCPHIFSILYSLRTISGVKLQLQWPRVALHAHVTLLHQIYDNAAGHILITISFETREVLIGRS